MDGDRCAFGHPDLEQHASLRRRDFRVDFVGGNLEERFVLVDDVADALDLADDGPFGDRLAHLGHQDITGHGVRPSASA
jgi:hypothetical protein